MLRERDPVHRSRLADGWILSRYRDVLEVLRDPSWSSDERNWSRYPRFRARGERAGLPDPYDEDRSSMLRLDPPDHTRLRGLVSKAFTPRAVEAMRPRIEALVDELLGRARGRAELALVQELAAPLPVIVIAEMLGVPPADHAWFRRMSDESIKLLGDSSIEERLEGVRATRELTEYFRRIVEERRASPRDDLVSAMVGAEESGNRLTMSELLATCILLLVAGNETTTKLIGNAVVALCRNPGQLELLRAEPKRIEGAIDEFLRYDGPVQLTSRLAREDRELVGRPVRRGQQIVLLLAAANRDPEAFTNPDRLDVTRENVRHVAFSHGLHFCLGAQLARLEAGLALEGLVRRFPAFRLADERIEWSPNTVLRGPLEVRLAL
jgi:cytochrome P450